MTFSTWTRRAGVALAAVALGAVAQPTLADAARMITGRQIKDGTITTRDIKNGTIRRADMASWPTSTTTTVVEESGYDEIVKWTTHWDQVVGGAEGINLSSVEFPPWTQLTALDVQVTTSGKTSCTGSTDPNQRASFYVFSGVPVAGSGVSPSSNLGEAKVRGAADEPTSAPALKTSSRGARYAQHLAASGTNCTPTHEPLTDVTLTAWVGVNYGEPPVADRTVQ